MAKSPRNDPRLAHRTRQRRAAAASKKSNETLYLGQWLARLGLEQQEVAKAAGIGKSYMSHLVSGKKANPATQKMLRISRVLKVTVNDLYQPPPTKEELERLRRYQPSAVGTLLDAGR